MKPALAVGVFSVLTLLGTCVGVRRASARGSGGAFFTSSCEGRVSPRKYTEAPCEIGQASYCTEPGEAYPRHAVRRFVSDNQGLMRRMYGDPRHLAVLRSEMEWNDVPEAEGGVITGRKSSLVDNDADYVDEESNDVNGVNVTLSTVNTAATTTTGNGSDNGNGSTTPPVTATVAPSTPTSGDANDTSNQPTEVVDEGINACPTRQEVVAPYWAVNTRGRTLAVVNDPPYEQHIHWEKCLHEKRQMLCRDGCKCEQQFRLQRLLAFDPACDCKGVFMDWFLLPSCCVCKCYGMSYEQTMTSNNTDTNTDSGATSAGRRSGRTDSGR